jgi:hypothetical protein
MMREVGVEDGAERWGWRGRGVIVEYSTRDLVVRKQKHASIDISIYAY